MRISDWSSDVCSSDLPAGAAGHVIARLQPVAHRHPLIEDIAVASPSAILLRHFLQIAQDAPAQMIDLFKSPRPDQRRRFFASDAARSEEHTSELQSLMRISYAVFCLKKKKTTMNIDYTYMITTYTTTIHTST